MEKKEEFSGLEVIGILSICVIIAFIIVGIGMAIAFTSEEVNKIEGIENKIRRMEGQVDSMRMDLMVQGVQMTVIEREIDILHASESDKGYEIGESVMEVQHGQGDSR